MLNIFIAGFIRLCIHSPDSSNVLPLASVRKVIVTDVLIQGNKTTKRSIVLREMIVKAGDTLDMPTLDKRLVKCKQNLLNTSLFNFVTITTIAADSTHLVVNLILKEAWYTWPAPAFEIVDRNVNVWWETKDLTRVNYGLDVTQFNFRGRNETVVAGFRSGYTQAFQLGYSIPYLTKSQKQGIGFYTSYSRNHEIPYTTYHNKLIFLRNPDFVRHVYTAAINYYYRQHIYSTHTLQVAYRNYQVNDTVLKLNPDFFKEKKNVQQYVSFVYNYRKDKRDFKPYPLLGHYYELELVKLGSGLLTKEIDLATLSMTYKRFIHIYKPMYYAFRLSGFTTLYGQHSFSTLAALGYNNEIVRGYEYYVIKGEHYGLFQSNIKFVLMKQKILKVKFISSEKFNTIPNSFYLNLNFDAGYVADNRFQKYNSLTNQVIYSYGIGLDYATYYSSVLRLEYSINKFAEAGFFLHFTIPI
jgi:outer membrane protein assembly factor BamA